MVKQAIHDGWIRVQFLIALNLITFDEKATTVKAAFYFNDY